MREDADSTKHTQQRLSEGITGSSGAAPPAGSAAMAGKTVVTIPAQQTRSDSCARRPQIAYCHLLTAIVYVTISIAEENAIASTTLQ